MKKLLLFLFLVLIFFGECNCAQKNWIPIAENVDLDSMKISLITTDVFQDSIILGLSTLIFIETDTLLNLKGYNYIKIESDLFIFEFAADGIYDPQEKKIVLFREETNYREELIGIEFFLRSAQITAFQEIGLDEIEETKNMLSFLYEIEAKKSEIQKELKWRNE